MQQPGGDGQRDGVRERQLQPVAAALLTCWGGDAEGFAVVEVPGPFTSHEHAGVEGVEAEVEVRE